MMAGSGMVCCLGKKCPFICPFREKEKELSTVGAYTGSVSRGMP